MGAALLIGRLGLAAVLLVAGLAKLLDIGSSRRALADFGVPAALVGMLGWLLPLTEIAIATLLLWQPAARVATFAAFALFAVFSVAIALNLWYGRKPSCGCFGRLDPRPISTSTMARTGLLCAGAGVLAWLGPGANLLSAATLAADNGVAVAVAAAAVLGLTAALQGVFIYMLLRQQGRLLLRLERVEAAMTGAAQARSEKRTVGLPIGTPSPDVVLNDAAGRAMPLANLVAGSKPVVLIFTDPDCPTCVGLLPDIARWRRELASLLTVAVVSVRESRPDRKAAAVYGEDNVYVQRQREVADLFEVVGTPSAVLIRADRTVGSRVAEGAEAIRELMTTVSPPSPVGAGSASQPAWIQ